MGSISGDPGPLDTRQHSPQLANRYGVRIPDQQLDEAMNRLARQNGLTLEQFRVALEQAGQSYAAARQVYAMTLPYSVFSKAM